MNRRLAAALLCGAAACLSAHALSGYYIGNSLTDCLNYSAFKTSVLALDKSYTWGRHMIPGAPLDWNWNHPAECIPGDVGGCYRSALTGFTWDVVTLQPYDRGISGSGSACCDNDSVMVMNYLSLAKAKSPSAQFFIYAQWPTRTADYDAAWLKPYPNGPRIKAYYERLTQAVQKPATGMKKILMIPAGHVLYELNQRIKTGGGVPDVSSVNDFYADDTHLNSKGSYVVACSFYACMYRRNPSELPYASYGISAALASAIQQAAWKVATGNPLTGVGSTTIRPAAATRGAGTPAGTAGWYGVDGRRLGGGSAHLSQWRAVSLRAAPGDRHVWIAR